MNQINDTPPEVIYLQWADHDTDVGATWCEHKINDDDVAYVAREKYDAAIVRAERAEAALKALYEACMAADADGELDSCIDGDLLDAARVVLIGGEG
jgi:hypothetical protein